MPSRGKDEETEPTAGDIAEANPTHLSVVIDGQTVEVKEQIQMYTTNELLSHPLVSPVMQPTLGGLPPLLVMVGGGEILRDEQIYLAHKCANPSRYLPPESTLNDDARAQIEQYKPTDVQLQVWDDLCHVAPTLSFTRPAKYMYRSVSQFGAWALARAQKTEIEILDDDDISFISNSTSDSDTEAARKVSAAQDRVGNRTLTKPQKDEETNHQESRGQVGKAGDALPPFKNHMIRQRVTRHGVIFPLAPSSELPGCTMDRELVGVPKQGPVKKWLAQKRQWDQRFASAKRKVHKRFVQDLAAGYEGFGDGELPPPSALAGRRKMEGVTKSKKRTKSMGLALWSLWGSKHDKMTMNREMEADKTDRAVGTRPATGGDGQGARSFGEIERQNAVAPISPRGEKSRSRRRRVTYEGQNEAKDEEDESDADDMAATAAAGKGTPQLLTPEYSNEVGVGVGVGSSGKRAYVGGIAVPFSLKKEAETASMMTLTSNISQGPQSPRVSTSRPMSPATVDGLAGGGGDAARASFEGNGDANGHERKGKGKEVAPSLGGGDSAVAAATGKSSCEAPTGERPALDNEAFVTAAEGLPTIKVPHSSVEVD